VRFRPTLAVLTGSLLAATVATAGCGSASSTSGSSPSASPTAKTTLTVFAAASLKGSFQKIADGFTADHTNVDVRLSFAGSSDLVAQIQQGAPADVIATADTTTMGKLVTDGLLTDAPKNFATNTLEIAVPPGNPAGITALADLAKPGVKVVLCAPKVPCGAAAAKVQTAAHVTITPVSEEQSVTDVLGKVSAGEADAGLVYVTDVQSAGAKVRGIPFPESTSVVNTYPIGVVKKSANAALAQQFVDTVLGAKGQAVLTNFGFAHP